MLSGLALYGLGCLLLAANDGSGRLALLPGIFVLSMAIPLFIGPVAFGTFAELHAKVFSHGYQVKNIVRQLGLSSSIAVTTLLLHRLDESPEQLGRLLTLLPHAGLPPALVASKLVFALMAASVLPLAGLVMVQRVFR